MHESQTEIAPLEEPPLVTFALFAYNQEKYIREAVAGVLAQTYQPLEIILSDDCSLDSTFEIMQEMASQYTGPNKIILNKNDKNFGLGKHIKEVFKKSSGDLIIAAAGDDISLPNRTSTLYENWKEEGKPLLICSNYKIIDESGKCTNDQNIEPPKWLNNFKKGSLQNNYLYFEDFLHWKLSGLYGSTSCWNRELINKYPEIRDDVWYEDRVFFLRALIENRLSYVNKKLVLYRQHSDSFTNKPPIKSKSFTEVINNEIHHKNKDFKRIGHLKQHLIDIEWLLNNTDIDKFILDKIYKISQNQLSLTEVKSIWWDESSFIEKYQLYRNIKTFGGANDIKWAKKRLLPIKIFAFCSSLKSYFKLNG